MTHIVIRILYHKSNLKLRETLAVWATRKPRLLGLFLLDHVDFGDSYAFCRLNTRAPTIDCSQNPAPEVCPEEVNTREKALAMTYPVRDFPFISCVVSEGRIVRKPPSYLNARPFAPPRMKFCGWP